jgi:hypothetical protein
MKNYFLPVVMSLLLSVCPCALWAQHVDTALPETRYKDFKTEHMWNAKVKIAGTLFVGDSKYGTRRMIPITGGSFEGAKIKGVVLPGGEDWQLVRPDGDTEMEARYLLKTDDGTVIRVTNRALMHFPPKGEKAEPYIKSVLEMEAPNNSPYAFLNHAIFLGTLEVPAVKPGEEPYVIIGVYRVL